MRWSTLNIRVDDYIEVDSPVSFLFLSCLQYFLEIMKVLGFTVIEWNSWVDCYRIHYDLKKYANVSETSCLFSMRNKLIYCQGLCHYLQYLDGQTIKNVTALLP